MRSLIALGTVLAVVGAVLTFAVQVNRTTGFNVNDAGVIAMIAGGFLVFVGLAYSRPDAEHDDEHDH